MLLAKFLFLETKRFILKVEGQKYFNLSKFIQDSFKKIVQFSHFEEKDKSRKKLGIFINLKKRKKKIKKFEFFSLCFFLLY